MATPVARHTAVLQLRNCRYQQELRVITRIFALHLAHQYSQEARIVVTPETFVRRCRSNLESLKSGWASDADHILQLASPELYDSPIAEQVPLIARLAFGQEFGDEVSRLWTGENNATSQ